MPKGIDTKLIILSYCPKCMLPVSMDEDSCKSCHTRFKEGVLCSRCGERVDPESDICDHCGGVFTAFYEYECPSCHHGIPSGTKRCPTCKRVILKPVRRETLHETNQKNDQSPRYEVTKKFARNGNSLLSNRKNRSKGKNNLRK